MSSGGIAHMENTDERVLCHLHEAGADYPALVASNTGLHIPLVERRMAKLREYGYVEKVTNEAIYRITDSGKDLLDGTSTHASD